MNLSIAALLVASAAGATLLQWCPRLPPAPGWLALVALCMMAAALFAFARVRGAHAVAIDSARVIAIALAAGLMGFFYAAWRADRRLADDLAPAWEERDIRVTGVVDDLPQNTAGGAHFAFAIERSATAGARVPHRVSIAWFAARVREGEVAGAAPEVHAGERWSLTLRLKRPHGNVNPDGFDLEAWLLEHDLRASGYVRDDPANLRIARFAGRAGDYVQRARERIRARIVAALPDAPYAGVLTALAIGDQRAIPESQWRVFNRTGITHLVSISGLHVTVFATLAGALALALARRSAALTLRVPARKAAAVVGAAFAFGYVLLAGAEVPAVRTLLMLLVAAAGLWLGRPGTAMLVWLWSLAAVLIWDPWAGLAPGFWLSFGAVGLLLYAGSGRLPGAPAAGFFAGLQESLRQGARAQWVVTLGLVPGTLALFQQVSLVSALANVVAIPVVTLGVVPLALAGIVIPLDTPWTLAHAVLQMLMRYLEWLSASPSATWVSHAPRGWAVAVAVAGLLWVFAPKGVPGRRLGLVWMLPMALVLPSPVRPGSVRIVVLDVGQGLAVFIGTAHHALIYDTGPRYGEATDAGARIVVPFLRAAGVARLDALVVSHADADHSGGAMSILQSVPVDAVMTSLPFDHPIVAQAPAPVRRCVAGDAWTWDGVHFAFLHPDQAAYEDRGRKSNDRSCVLRIQSAGGSALLTGDIEAASELEIIGRRDPAPRADVLVVPHHGSRTSSTPTFIAAVSPAVAIIAAGYRNRFGHPRTEIVARYVHAGARPSRTDLQGAIGVTLEPDLPVVAQGERERRPRYWYDVPDADAGAASRRRQRRLPRAAFRQTGATPRSAPGAPRSRPFWVAAWA